VLGGLVHEYELAVARRALLPLGTLGLTRATTGTCSAASRTPRRRRAHADAPPQSAKGRTCTDVVGIFPNDKALIRLAASVVIEQNDEWLVGRRYLSNHSLETLIDQEEKAKTKTTEETRELTTA
jgi:hypothetical protein